MSEEEHAPAVVRVGLKRVNLYERVLGDDELRHAPCARLLGEELLRDLLAAGTGRRFSNGARLFLVSDAGDSIFLLLKGEVRLSAGTGADAVELAAARKGDLFGECEDLGDGSVRTCSASAVGDVEVVEFPRRVIDRFARQKPAFAEYLDGLAAARAAAGAEMAEFLARW